MKPKFHESAYVPAAQEVKLKTEQIMHLKMNFTLNLVDFAEVYQQKEMYHSD